MTCRPAWPGHRDPRRPGWPIRPHWAAASPPGAPGRGPVFVPFLPVVLLWVVLAGAIHASGVVVPAIILLFVCLRLARRHDHGGDHRPGDSPPRTGGGPA